MIIINLYLLSFYDNTVYLDLKNVSNIYDCKNKNYITDINIYSLKYAIILHCIVKNS